MKCPTCHATLDDTAKFCTVCGERLTLAPQAASAPLAAAADGPAAPVRAAATRAQAFATQGSVAFKTIAQANVAARDLQRAEDALAEAQLSLEDAEGTLRSMNVMGVVVGALAAYLAVDLLGDSYPDLFSMLPGVIAFAVMFAFMAWGVIGIRAARHEGSWLVVLNVYVMVAFFVVVLLVAVVGGPFFYAAARRRVRRRRAELAGAEQVCAQARAVVM